MTHSPLAFIYHVTFSVTINILNQTKDSPVRGSYVRPMSLPSLRLLTNALIQTCTTYHMISPVHMGTDKTMLSRTIDRTFGDNVMTLFYCMISLVHDLALRIERTLTRRPYVKGCFMDIHGAYANVTMDSTGRCLIDRDTTRMITRWLVSIYMQWRATSTLGDSETTVALSHGRQQGGVISPLCTAGIWWQATYFYS